MMVKTWKVQPIEGTIIEILENKGFMTDCEIYDMLKAFYQEMGFDDLNRTLMKMEVSGLISVYSLSKDKRKVELTKKAR